MFRWRPHLLLEAELKKLDDRLNAAPEDIGLSFDRAAMLDEMGRTHEAKLAYLELLYRAPTHFGALNNLGTLLNATGYGSAARTAYAEAVKHHPDNPTGHVNLANVLAKTGATDAARMHFEQALRLDPEHPEAHQGLSYLLADLGLDEAARIHRVKGFQHHPILVLPYRGADFPIALLVLASAVGGMVPIRHHLDDRVFFVSVLFVEFFDPATAYPPHQLVFNAVGDADICKPALEAALRLLQRTNAPVVNPPAAVLATGRAANAERFRGLPGVVVPRIVLLPRETLAASDAPSLLAERGFAFPLLLRSPGFHGGKNFIRIETADELAAASTALPGAELMVIEHLDARGPDGKVRKYRVMMIDGNLYPLHAAISLDWKVHYFSADMAENPEHRAQDEAFLTHMEQVLGPRAMQALRHIQRALGLDYAGIDFSLNAAGELLLFEANATMVVLPPEPDARWDYRRAPVQRILDAIRRMLVDRAKPGVLAETDSHC
jgi:glutathione synthase/RimK-type ligase-like ATP-grasp enzyme